jgi:zinc transport system ATP-binding protein
VVLHELGPFEPLIGRTVVLREGRVVYDGAPTGLLGLPHDVHCDPAGPAGVVVPPLRGPLGEGRP